MKGHALKIRGLGDFHGCKKALVGLLRNDPATGSGGEISKAGSADNSMGSQMPCTGGSSCNDYMVDDFHR